MRGGHELLGQGIGHSCRNKCSLEVQWVDVLCDLLLLDSTLMCMRIGGIKPREIRHDKIVSSILSAQVIRLRHSFPLVDFKRCFCQTNGSKRMICRLLWCSHQLLWYRLSPHIRRSVCMDKYRPAIRGFLWYALVEPIPAQLRRLGWS